MPSVRPIRLAGRSIVSSGGAFESSRFAYSPHCSIRGLTALRPELAGIGAVKLNADFDLAQQGDLLVVERLDAAVMTDQPVATIRSLQAFELNPATGALKAGDSSRELLDVLLQGVPLGWAAPLLKDVTVTGGDLRGQVIMASRGGGMTLRKSVEGRCDRVRRIPYRLVATDQIRVRIDEEDVFAAEPASVVEIEKDGAAADERFDIPAEVSGVEAAQRRQELPFPAGPLQERFGWHV
jgi:hypothetical protein